MTETTDSTERDEDESALAELGEYVRLALGDAVDHVHVTLGELCVHVSRSDIIRVLTFLRDDSNCGFSQLADITAVDYPDEEQRFELVYNLLNIHRNQRIRIKAMTDADTPVASACTVWPSANWFEREIWDLFGVWFTDHPDLRRLMTDYGFEGHPLRKDFPLTGYVEVRYDDALKRVVYEPVKLTQDFRTFDYLSPWEGMTDIMLPGDEKAVRPAHTATRGLEVPDELARKGGEGA